MIHTTTLPDGTLKHRMGGWTGYQDPNQSMAKTKWYKDGTKYWEVTTPSKSRPGQTNTYIVTRDSNNRMNCEKARVGMLPLTNDAYLTEAHKRKKS